LRNAVDPKGKTFNASHTGRFFVGNFMKQTLFDLEIIAGPCSLTAENAREIMYEIADVTTPGGQRAIFGTRAVGLKSRTAFDSSGFGAGMDFYMIQECLRLTKNQRRNIVLPSVLLAGQIAKNTGMLVAAEIMLPDIQLPFYAQQPELDGHLLIWNPAVDQLGWHIAQMAVYAQTYNWKLGIKNGKFLGDVHLTQADHPDYDGETLLEKTWQGLITYAAPQKNPPILIHRGVDVPQKGHFRNAPVHEIVKRVKRADPKLKIYFDPSHSFGPKLRDKIVQGTIDAMKLTVNGSFLYEGVLIETGTSPSDTNQHITVKELQQMVTQLSDFRLIRKPAQKAQSANTQSINAPYEK
jgi:3-deoxy-D-arabino-heptulosonate 7-phosphate (DAHP) synthase